MADPNAAVYGSEFSQYRRHVHGVEVSAGDRKLEIKLATSYGKNEEREARRTNQRSRIDAGLVPPHSGQLFFGLRPSNE
jgi:hypothetical protein